MGHCPVRQLATALYDIPSLLGSGPGEEDEGQVWQAEVGRDAEGGSTGRLSL